jgi:CRISPR-associated protein Cas5d
MVPAAAQTEPRGLQRVTRKTHFIPLRFSSLKRLGGHVSKHLPRPYRLLVWGDYACFARPELRVERVSYPIMTPSAACGALGSVFWKPQFAWQVERIDRLRPVRFEQVRRNEVAVKASRDRPGIVVDQERQQRAMLMLRDVAYVIHARPRLTAKAGPDDTLAKYAKMFERRAGAGQCFQRPCLGAREFAANFRLLDPDETDPPAYGAVASEALGWVFYGFDWSRRPPLPRFFEAQVEHGRMAVPTPDSLAIRA